MKLSRVAILLLLLSSTAIAQSEFPPKGKYKHNKKIESTYDKFKDQTVVRLSYLSPLPAISAVTLTLVPQFVYPGKTPKPPERVGLWIQSNSSDWQFLRNRQLLVIADGERFDLGEAIRVNGKVNSGAYRRSSVTVSEMMAVAIPLETFLKLIKAKSVEMQLGAVEFKLADDHLEALRDFASRMAPE